MFLHETIKKYVESEKTYGFLIGCFLGIVMDLDNGESFEDFKEISSKSYFSSLSSFLPDSPFPHLNKPGLFCVKKDFFYLFLYRRLKKRKNKRFFRFVQL
jgi:hypothetical protein